MEIERIGRVIQQLAQNVSPGLVPAGWQPNEDNVRALAYRLAVDYDLLILVGRVPRGYMEYRNDYLRIWINHYIDLYNLFARTLFGHGDAQLTSHAHQAPDTIIILRGDVTEVMAAIAGYVVPYVASRQQIISAPSDAEIRQIINAVLDHLEGQDLATDRRAALMREGTKIIKDLWRQPVRQYATTAFLRHVVRDLPTPPPSLPSTDFLAPPEAEPPTPPPLLPELNLSEEDSQNMGQTQRLVRRLAPAMPLPRHEDTSPSRSIPMPPLTRPRNDDKR